MKLTKGFFRKRKTKIFMIIFSVVLLGIISIFSLSKYYDQLMNEYNETYSYIFFVSKKNYTEELLNRKSVKDVKRGVLLLPDYSYETLSNTPLATNSSAHMDSFVESKIYWDSFLVDSQYIEVYLGSDFGYVVEKGKTVILYPYSKLEEPQLNTLKKLQKEKIGFETFHHEKIELEIAGVSDYPHATILVSCEDYDNLQKEEALYSYRVDAKSYKLVDSLRRDLLDMEREEDFGVINTGYAMNEEYRQQLVLMILFLQIGSYISIFLMFIVFIISCKSILKEERKNIYIERMTGYNKLQICKHLLLHIVLLFGLSLGIAIVLSAVLFALLNSLCNFHIAMIDMSIIMQVFGIAMILFLIELLFFFFQIHKCLKEDYLRL